MESTWTILTTLCLVICLPSVLSRSLSKRAAFYIANETACVVDSIVYYNGDPIPTDDPCEACKCRPPGFACVLRECEVKPGCRAVRKAGHCCPDYICGCEHNGRMFRDGDEIRDSQNPCYTCHCQGSAIACAFVDCFFRVDCAPDYVPGECCPRYDHCSPLGPSFNDSISKDVTSSKQPSTTTTTKATVSIEVFTDDPFLGFADFGADGSVEGLRRKTTTTTTTENPDLTDNDKNKISDIPSDVSSTFSTSTTVKTVETSKIPNESEDSTTPVFYVPEKDSATENSNNENESNAPNDKSTEDAAKRPDETTTKQSSTESANDVTEEIVTRETDNKENIENGQTENTPQQEVPTTEQSSKLLLYSDNDEHNFSNDFIPSTPEKESEEKVILSEIHDAQDHVKENIGNIDKNPVTTTEKSATTKIAFGDRIKSTSTITPIPVLLSNSKEQNEYEKDNSKPAITTTEVNKEHTDTTEKKLSDTEDDLKFLHNEDDKQIVDVKSTEQSSEQILNQNESTTTSDFISNNREGKKKNVIVNEQKLPTELPPTTVNTQSTKGENTQTEDLTTTPSRTTFQATIELIEKLNDETHELKSKVETTKVEITKVETTPTVIISKNTETSTEINPTQITEEENLSNQKITTKISPNSESPSTVTTNLSESQTKSTSSLQTGLSDKDIHIGHEITH